MENKNLTITTNEGKEIFVIDSREVAEMMGKTHSALLKDLQGSKDGKSIGIIPTLESEGLDCQKYFIPSTYKAGTREYKCYLVTKIGLELLSSKQQGIKGIIFNTLFNDGFKTIECNDDIKNDAKLICETLKETHKRAELEFLDILEETLKPFNIQGVRQYLVKNFNGVHYRIDYCIPSLNIAIEYDENGHEHYTYEKQEGRQKEIENKLGCRFIRVTDNDSHYFNIGKVIKEIFNI